MIAIAPRARAAVAGLAGLGLAACAGGSSDRPSATIPPPEAVAPNWIAAPSQAVADGGLGASGCTTASNLLAFDRTKAVTAATGALRQAVQAGMDAVGVEATVGRQDLTAAMTEQTLEVEAAGGNQVCALVVLSPQDAAALFAALGGGAGDLDAFITAARAAAKA